MPDITLTAHFSGTHEHVADFSQEDQLIITGSAHNPDHTYAAKYAYPVDTRTLPAANNPGGTFSFTGSVDVPDKHIVEAYGISFILNESLACTLTVDAYSWGGIPRSFGCIADLYIDSDPSADLPGTQQFTTVVPIRVDMGTLTGYGLPAGSGLPGAGATGGMSAHLNLTLPRSSISGYTGGTFSDLIPWLEAHRGQTALLKGRFVIVTDPTVSDMLGAGSGTPPISGQQTRVFLAQGPAGTNGPTFSGLPVPIMGNGATRVYDTDHNTDDIYRAAGYDYPGSTNYLNTAPLAGTYTYRWNLHHVWDWSLSGGGVDVNVPDDGTTPPGDDKTIVGPIANYHDWLGRFHRCVADEAARYWRSWSSLSKDWEVSGVLVPTANKVYSPCITGDWFGRVRLTLAEKVETGYNVRQYISDDDGLTWRDAGVLIPGAKGPRAAQNIKTRDSLTLGWVQDPAHPDDSSKLVLKGVFQAGGDDTPSDPFYVLDNHGNNLSVSPQGMDLSWSGDMQTTWVLTANDGSGVTEFYSYDEGKTFIKS